MPVSLNRKIIDFTVFFDIDASGTKDFPYTRDGKVHKKSPTAQNPEVFGMQDIPFSSSRDWKEIPSQSIQSLRTPGRLPLNSNLPRICLFLSVPCFGLWFSIQHRRPCLSMGAPAYIFTRREYGSCPKLGGQGGTRRRGLSRR